MKKIKSKKVLTAVISVLTILLSSCPLPLTDTVMNNARDAVAPVIKITTPASYSSYSRTLYIEGKVTDLSDSGGAPGRIQNLYWEILTQTSAEKVNIQQGGNFTIEYNVPSTLTENIVLYFKAEDWNGNTSDFRLPLVYQGNDIPSFSVTGGNRKAVLTWDNVPGADTYTLYFEPSALTPAENSSAAIEDISSPYTLENLKDGTTYSFLLKASSTAGPDNYSSVQRTIPLSTMHLFPRTTGTFNYIEITWPVADGINTYEVFRSESPSGPFKSISGPITGGSYKDWNVHQGTSYFYSIRPSENCSILSKCSEGRLHPFPPFTNSKVADYMSPEYPQSSAVKGNYLYITDYRNGLNVVDISEPSVPINVAELNIPSADEIVISGNTAYITGRDTLYIVDISDPFNPNITGSTIVTVSQAEGLDIYNDIAAVACFNDGFSLVDISDPSSPSVSYHENLTGGIYDLGQVYNTKLKEINGTLYLFISDINKTPVYKITGSASNISLSGESSTMCGSDECDFSENGNYIFLASSWYLTSYDITNPSNPVNPSQFNPSPNAGVERVNIIQDRAYITMRNTGFGIVDISDPSAMTEKSIVNSPGEATNVTVSDGYAYLCDGEDFGVHIYGVAEPEEPSLLYTYTGLSDPKSIGIQDKYLYIINTSNNAEMAVFDISVPESPVYKKSTWQYSPESMKIAGNRIYIAGNQNGISMNDLTDPETPGVIPPWHVSVQGGYPKAIDAYGRYGAVVTAGSYLNIFDLSWSESFFSAGVLNMGGSAGSKDVIITDKYAYVANSTDGIFVVDISNPAVMTVLNTLAGAGGCSESIEIAGDYLYSATSNNGLVIYDISDPDFYSVSSYNPLISTGGGTTAYDLEIRGDYAVLACGSSGIEIYNIYDPENPVQILTYTGITADKILLSGNLLYVLDTAGGKLHVLDLQP